MKNPLYAILDMIERIGGLGLQVHGDRSWKRVKRACEKVQDQMDAQQRAQEDTNKAVVHLGWEVMKAGLKRTQSQIRICTVQYDGCESWLSRLAGGLHFRIACFVYYGHVRRLMRLLAKGERTIAKVDELVARHKLKAIDRPSEFVADDIRGAFRADREKAKQRLDDAYTKLEAYSESWQEAMNLMARQMELFKDGKWNLSAVEAKRMEAEEKARKKHEEEDACKVAVLGGKRLHVEWKEVKNIPFDVSGAYSPFVFRGSFYVRVGDELWRGADGCKWKKTSVPFESCLEISAGTDVLIAWTGLEGAYFFTLDGENWKPGKAEFGGFLSRRCIFRFADKWLLTVRESEKCRIKMKRGWRLREVELDTDKSRLYVTDNLSSGWTEIEKMSSANGYIFDTDCIITRAGKLYVKMIPDSSFWTDLKEEVQKPYWRCTSDLAEWEYTPKSDGDLPKMSRFGAYGCLLSRGADWAELTTDGVDYARLYLGEETSEYAVSGSRMLKITPGRKGPLLSSGGLLSRQTDTRRLLIGDLVGL